MTSTPTARKPWLSSVLLTVPGERPYQTAQTIEVRTATSGGALPRSPPRGGRGARFTPPGSIPGTPPTVAEPREVAVQIGLDEQILDISNRRVSVAIWDAPLSRAFRRLIVPSRLGAR